MCRKKGKHIELVPFRPLSQKLHGRTPKKAVETVYIDRKPRIVLPNRETRPACWRRAYNPNGMCKKCKYEESCSGKIFI